MRGRKRIKFGKKIGVYLSNEAIAVIDNMCNNRTAFIEKLILDKRDEIKHLPAFESDIYTSKNVIEHPTIAENKPINDILPPQIPQNKTGILKKTETIKNETN